MNCKTISVVALSNRDFPSFSDKLREAAQWIEIAADHGAQLVVLPEALNLYRGDGPGNPNAMTYAQAALPAEGWQAACAPLLDAAARRNLALAVPLLLRDPDGWLSNCFFLVGARGEVLGRYDKTCPTPGELDQRVRPAGEQPLIEWEGLKVGGAICFDTNFQHVFESQARRGAQLFLAPSLWPGGSYINYYALRYSTPIVLAYPAWSRIVDIDGCEVAAGGYRHETLRFGFGTPVFTTTLNFDRAAFHADFNAPLIARVQRECGPRARVKFDQQNALFFIESCSPDLPLCEIIARFNLVRVQDYFTEATRPRSVVDAQK